MSSLSLKHIYKVYAGGVRAVNDFNLEIKDKSFVVLVGPSGCGKSTTLRMIAGLEEITSGQLYIDDTCVNDVESKNRDIAMVFQSYALYPHMTVFQNMAFGLKLRHENPKVIKEKVLQAAETLEITELLDRKPKELSGGQRQRVALGRAIVREPNVFLLDEPLSNLDAKLRVQMRTEITKLHEKLQTTFIYVTHDQTEAMTMGDIIVVMKGGFIQQADTPISLFEDPTNLFVATFLGSPQMNIIPVKLIESNGKYFAVLAGVGSNSIELREETSKQLASIGVNLEKDFLFGIRPDHISLSTSGIPATVEVVEQLGDETLVYTKVEGHDKYVTVKLPLTGTIEVGQKVHLKLDLNKIYLFDKETEASIVGVPLMNSLPCLFDGNEIFINKNNRITVSEDYAKHLRTVESGEKLFLGLKPEDISLEETPESVSMSVKVDFIEERTLYKAVFAKVEGINDYLVFRAPHDTKLKAGSKVNVYFKMDKVGLYDEAGDAVKSREELYLNKATAVVKTIKGKTNVTIIGGEKLVYDDLELEDGIYDLNIKQDKVRIVFNKKMAKAIGVDFVPASKGQVLNFSCYDEEPVGKKNFIFGKLKGFQEYVTIVAENNFSVYKMPKFKIEVPSEAIELKKVEE